MHRNGSSLFALALALMIIYVFRNECSPVECSSRSLLVSCSQVCKKEGLCHWWMMKVKYSSQTPKPFISFMGKEKINGQFSFCFCIDSESKINYQQSWRATLILWLCLVSSRFPRTWDMHTECLYVNSSGSLWCRAEEPATFIGCLHANVPSSFSCFCIFSSGEQF